MAKMNINHKAFANDMAAAGIVLMALAQINPDELNPKLLRKMARVSLKNAVAATVICNAHVNDHPEDEDPEFKNGSVTSPHDLVDNYLGFLAKQHPDHSWMIDLMRADMQRTERKAQPLAAPEEGFAI